MTDNYVEAVRQRQADLAEQQRDLYRKKAQLDSQELPLNQALMRATGSLPKNVCLDYWVWKGERVEPARLPGDGSVDRFNCSGCGHEYETPAD